MRIFILIFTLTAGLVMAKEYPESFDVVSEKHDSVGFEALDDTEKAIYAIGWLEAEINNGGFHQYFWNSAGDHASLALESLRAIGASETALLLQQAIEVAFNGLIPESRELRQAQLEINEEEKEDKLYELDLEFYKYRENFYLMLDIYVPE